MQGDGIDAAAGRNDDAAGRFGPAAAVIQAGTHADGAENGIGARVHAVHLFDQRFGGETEIHAAAGEEPGGVRVAVDGAIAGEFVDIDNFVRLAPVDEVFFDFFALGMVADEAFALVILQRGRVEWGKKGSDGAGAGRSLRVGVAVGGAARGARPRSGGFTGGGFGDFLDGIR